MAEWPEQVADSARLPREIVLVRHGETEWSRGGRHTGLTDVPLDGIGVEQARAIGPRLAGESFDVVLVSPLERARETARLAGYGERAVVTADLREWDYGSYEGLTTAEIRAERPGWLLFDDGCPGGESAADVGRRADRVLAVVREGGGAAGTGTGGGEDGRTGGAGAGRALLFAHGHMLRVLAARWLGLDAREGRLLALEPATLSRLGWEHETAVIRAWNA